ncbi:MAG: aminotransferase class III-fold pyridoxal phosphate-dependent enzyme [Defluviitaleaceae bacterium]|nr:aminotransferase class III-fold pyridoxal phosphate-dependent enzyme [Defluviitaleaceae bacterium]
MSISGFEMKDYHNRVKRILPGGIHYNFRSPWEEIPVYAAKCKGSRVWDMNGTEYLDLFARFGAMILGHSCEEYNNGLKDAIDRILGVSHCDLDAEVLELINKFVPSAEMIRFGLSGTEIVQVALRIARAYTKKNRFVRFYGHYHGYYDNIMGGRSPISGEPIPSDYEGDVRGTDGRAESSFEQSYLLPWNSIEAVEELLLKNADKIAAIITEPVCVNGGGIMPSPGYLEALRHLCDKYNVVLIFDEIITGFRMGLGGAQEVFGVTPDLTVFGKAMAGGGVPVSAVVGKRELMKLIENKSVIHAGTFNGYALGMAAVKITLEILSRDNCTALEQMNRNASTLHEILIREAAKVGLPLVIQGPQGCASFHCCEKELAHTTDYTFDIMLPDSILSNNFKKNGVLISPVSRLFTNLSLSNEDLEWFRDRSAKALKQTKEDWDEFIS